MTGDLERCEPVIVQADRPEGAMSVIAAAHPGETLVPCADQSALPKTVAAHGARAVYSVRSQACPFPGDALFAVPSLEWISVGGSGTDHLGAWDPARAAVTNAAGVAGETMAEYALGTLLSVTLGLRERAADQAERRWRGDASVERAAGRTALVLGMGGTGRAVARLFAAAGLTVIGVRARPGDPVQGAAEIHPPGALPRLWPRADVVVVCVPLLASTRGLVGREAFAAMERRPMLIDLSRGGVVEPADLIEALEEGWLRAAALDVFETEPLPPGSPLWNRPDVIVTPHCSSVDAGWERRAAEMFAANLTRFRAGAPLENVVDPARGY